MEGPSSPPGHVLKLQSIHYSNKLIEPTSGRVDRASAPKTVDLGSIAVGSIQRL